MQHFSFRAIGAAALVLAAQPAGAAAAEEAKAFSERAGAHIMAVGEAQAFADFTRRDGRFIDGELHIFCYDRHGVNKARGGNPAFVGRNLLHIKDPDGAEPNALIVNMGSSRGAGGSTSNGPNPVTKRIAEKSAYVIRTTDVVCGAGYCRG